MGNFLEGFLNWWRGLFVPGNRVARLNASFSDVSRLYVGNLSYSAKENELRELFSRYGRVLGVDIITDRITRKPKGYAFVEMPSDDASKALDLNGNDFLSRKIVVSLARDKGGNERGGGNGGNGGGNAEKSGSAGGDGGRRRRRGGRNRGGRERGGNGNERGNERGGERGGRERGGYGYKGSDRPQIERLD